MNDQNILNVAVRVGQFTHGQHRTTAEIKQIVTRKLSHELAQEIARQFYDSVDVRGCIQTLTTEYRLSLVPLTVNEYADLRGQKVRADRLQTEVDFLRARVKELAEKSAKFDEIVQLQRQVDKRMDRIADLCGIGSEPAPKDVEF
jgi:hypothetical protein